MINAYGDETYSSQWPGESMEPLSNDFRRWDVVSAN
jgi:hypothetical protein